MCRSMIFVALLLTSLLAQSQPGGPAPAGYWEGKVSRQETPMKDPNKSLTRNVEAEFWFTVTWDPRTRSGTLRGEAEAKYDSVLRVENLPKVTAPAPGGNVKFEPSVGGQLEGDTKRKFPIVGVIQLDRSEGGKLYLTKVGDTLHDQLTPEQQARSFDARLRFVMRADPGISGSVGVGRGATVNYSKGGVGVDYTPQGPKGADGKPLETKAPTTSNQVNTGISTEVIVKEIPIPPFDPFTPDGGEVVKRAGGPYVATFDLKTASGTVKWTAKQMGGENREARPLSPQEQEALDKLLKSLRNPRR